jgi:hypothetical protein
MNWVIQSLIAGVFVAIGMIFVRSAAASIPSFVVVGLIGFVWFLASGGMILYKHLTEGFSLVTFGYTLIGLALLAGVFFWLENIFRFSAMPKAPLTGYVFLIIEAVAVVITVAYDLIRLYKAGELNTISAYQVIGMVLLFAGITLFQFAPKNN